MRKVKNANAKQRLSLEALKVKSFVTGLDISTSKHLKGGGPPTGTPFMETGVGQRLAPTTVVTEC